MGLLLGKYYHKFDSKVKDAKPEAIEISEPFRWFFEDNKKGEYIFHRDFPCVRPPYDALWMEARCPYDWLVDIPGMGHAIHLQGVGGIFVTSPLNEDDALAMMEFGLYSYLYAKGEFPATGPTGRDEADMVKAADQAIRDAWDRGRRLSAITFFDGYIFHRSLGPVSKGGMFFALDHVGDIIEQKNYIAMGNTQFSHTYRGDITSFVLPFLFGLSLCNARNVSLEDIVPPRKVARKRKKRGKPLFTYKVLRIDPQRVTQKQEPGAGPGEKGVKAFHLCRGHFKRYTEEAPLFGRYVGTVWCPSHTRGQLSRGRVYKDYEVAHDA